MTDVGTLEQEIASLRSRFGRFNRASLRINETLDFETVMQGVLDNACSLTDARFGVLMLLDDSAEIIERFASGMSSAEADQLWARPGATEFWRNLSRLSEPLRHRDARQHAASLGLPELHLPGAGGRRVPLPGGADSRWRPGGRQLLPWRQT